MGGGVREPPSMPDRRRFLATGLAAVAAPAILSRRSRAADLGVFRLRLCWINNAQFAGEYYADSRGYYRAEGFSGVELLGGGPSAPPVEADLMQEKCLLGLSAVDFTAAAVAQGAALRTVGAQYQKSAFCMVSLASRPIPEPRAMIGRRIGVQAANTLVFSTFLQLNGIDPGRVQVVPVQFDPTPMVAGEVDGWVGYIGNEPNTLKIKGIETTVFLFADHNYPLVMETYVARQSSTVHEREQLKAALRAEIRGWKDNLRDPDGGAMLAVTRYGRSLGLDPAAEKLQSRTENTLIASADTARQGLLMLKPDLIERNVKVLRDLGNEVTAADLFDMSLLEEIYRDDPSLIRV